MPDSKKSTIVIASVLKPVDDSRMYEKIAVTLASVDTYDVHVIGCSSASTPDPRVRVHPFKPFARISLRRIFAPLVIFVRAWRLGPDLFIATTHELLFPAVFLKWFTRCRVIYDVQENYYWNILYTPAFPLLIKPFLALYVRSKEVLTSRWVDHFFLAEQGYERELKFPGNRKTVLENKVRIDPSVQRAVAPPASADTIRLIFSGTLAQTTGVFTALDLAIKLHVLDDRIRLTIIGHCPKPDVLERLRTLAGPRPFIEIIAQKTPLAHSLIFEHIKKAHFGIISYEINPSTMNSVPTKLYEYLGFRLPILLVNHKPWVEFCHRWSAAVVFNPAHPDAPRLYERMMSQRFYTTDPAEVYWQSEEPRLLQAVREAGISQSP